MGLHKGHVYPADWVYAVIGKSSGSLNNALTMHAVGLLLAMEENERAFPDRRFWDYSIMLRSLALNRDRSPDIKAEIVARLEEQMPAFDMLDRGIARLTRVWIEDIRNMSLIRCLALLAVVEALNCNVDEELEWWTKEAFLIRRGILQKGA